MVIQKMRQALRNHVLPHSVAVTEIVCHRVTATGKRDLMRPEDELAQG
jgi:hypothetical protein